MIKICFIKEMFSKKYTLAINSDATEDERETYIIDFDGIMLSHPYPNVLLNKDRVIELMRYLDYALKISGYSSYCDSIANES